MQDKERFGRNLIRLASGFGEMLSPHRIDSYWEALNDLDDDAFELATVEALKTRHRFPMPVDLREAVNGKLGAVALLAQHVVETAMASVGAYASVDFEDPAVNASLRGLGGWSAVCSIDAGEWRRFRSREFRTLYEAHSQRGGAGELARPLPGIVEATNGQRGLEAPEPRQVRCPYLRVGRLQAGPETPQIEARSSRGSYPEA